MSFNKKTYRQIAKDILAQMSEGEVTEQQTFAKGKTLYKLTNTPVTKIKTIEGLMKNKPKIFAEGVDYRLTDDCVEWLGGGGEHPDDNTIYKVKCIQTRSPGISDVHPGSVARTLVEAISREIEYFYLQMEQAYLSGFLDTATGKALDLVVSILGIKRKPPQPSSGIVTFGRNTEPELLSINGEVHLYDGSLEYPLNKPLVKDIVKIEGTSNNSSTTFEKEIDYTLTHKSVRWLPEGKKPDAKTVFRIDYSAYREIVIPKGANVATFSLKPEETRLFTTIEDSSLASTAEAKWEAEVSVICTVPGRIGNVLAGTVVVMPQAVPGVEYVINKADITNGVEAEQDNELKERTKHALEFAGKATYTSVESAIKSVEGVRSLLIEDMPDGVSGIVKVIVDGGSMDRIVGVIDDTRAAGIKVEVCRPQIVHINVSLTLVMEKDAAAPVVAMETEKRIRNYISNLEIGDDVLYSRLVESIVSPEGVWDVQNVRMTAHRPEGLIVESELENLEISNEERAEPRNINISFQTRK
jgi:uncharacterized phage protein gp47/JayE